MEGNCMKSPLIWPGGKGNQINKFLKYVPIHECYVEPFFGGGNLFFHKKRVSFETINDINSDVVNFFRVLKDENKFKEFYKLINLTPYSREIFTEAKNNYKSYPFNTIERAYYWFITLRQSFSGNCSSWSYGVNNTDNRKINQTIGRWLSCIDNLPEVCTRLKYTQIENDDFEKVIDIYDNDKCFIYCDPPYLHETRKEKNMYEYEMSRKDHERFLTACNKAKSKIMISGYYSDLYNTYLEKWIIKKHKVKVHMNNSRTSKNSDRIECLWMNYQGDLQPELF